VELITIAKLLLFLFALLAGKFKKVNSLFHYRRELPHNAVDNMILSLKVIGNKNLEIEL
jgi:hypothetical protein